MTGKVILCIVGGVAALYLAALLALFLAQRALLFPAPRDASGAPPTGFSAARLDTEDGLQLAAAYRPRSGDHPTIIFFHGNGDSLAGAEAATHEIGAAGYGLLLVEYRGYAGNPGSPDEEGLYRDGRAALVWLKRRGIGPRCMVLVGNSLGSGVATALAAQEPVAGLVLISGFTSTADVAASRYPWLPIRMLLRDRFDNRAKIGDVNAPILLLHGTADRLIPARHSMALASMGKHATLGLVPGAGHDLAYSAGSQAMILRWLARLRAAQARPGCASDDQAIGASPSAAASHPGMSASPSASVRRNATIIPKSG